MQKSRVKDAIVQNSGVKGHSAKSHGVKGRDAELNGAKSQGIECNGAEAVVQNFIVYNSMAQKVEVCDVTVHKVMVQKA